MYEWLKSFLGIENTEIATIVDIEKKKCSVGNGDIAEAGYTEEDTGYVYVYLAKVVGKDKYWTCKNYEYNFIWRHYISAKNAETLLKREENIFYQKYKIGDKIEFPVDEEECEEGNNTWQRCDPWKEEGYNDNCDKK